MTVQAEISETFCPACDSRMILHHTSKYGAYLCCSSFPICKETQAVNQVTKEPLGFPLEDDIRVQT
jgi:ssDNA-binding Zn-finger/Zn-ribbon topoisomerase 1